MAECILPLIFLAPQESGSPAIHLEQRKLFALLDRFDDLETGKLMFVRVVRSIQRSGHEPQNIYRYGFLLESKGRRFTVRYLDLGKETREITSTRTAANERVRWEPIDMRKYAKQVVAELREQRVDLEKRRFQKSPDHPAPPELLATVLARACARRGLVAEARALWDALPPLPKTRRALADGLATRLTLEFLDPSMPFERLLTRHKTWLHAFADHDLRASVEQQKGALEFLVIEERQRRTTGAVERNKVSDLVLDLRHETHPVSTRPTFGSLAIVPPGKPPPNRPSTRLIALGLDSVPALIARLDDNTLTRSVRFSGRGFHPRPLREVAREVLVEIAALDLYEKKDWKRWYANAAGSGLRAALVGSLSVPNHELDAATALLKRYPDALPDVLAAAGRAKEDNYLRYNLVRIACGSHDERVTAFLRRELRDGPSLKARVTAAEWLLHRGLSDGVGPMIREWRSLGSRKWSEPMPPFDKAIGRTEPRQLLLDFLLSSGDPVAWRTVAGDLDTVAIRHTFLRHLHSARPGTILKRVPQKQRKAVEEVLQGMLVACLDDGTRFEFIEGWKLEGLPRASHAEFAAEVLSTHWPKLYEFHPAQTEKIRQRQIDAIRRQWRRRKRK